MVLILVTAEVSKQIFDFYYLKTQSYNVLIKVHKIEIRWNNSMSAAIFHIAMCLRGRALLQAKGLWSEQSAAQ